MHFLLYYMFCYLWIASKQSENLSLYLRNHGFTCLKSICLRLSIFNSQWSRVSPCWFSFMALSHGAVSIWSVLHQFLSMTKLLESLGEYPRLLFFFTFLVFCVSPLIFEPAINIWLSQFIFLKALIWIEKKKKPYTDLSLQL